MVERISYLQWSQCFYVQLFLQVAKELKQQRMLEHTIAHEHKGDW